MNIPASSLTRETGSFPRSEGKAEIHFSVAGESRPEGEVKRAQDRLPVLRGSMLVVCCVQVLRTDSKFTSLAAL